MFLWKIGDIIQPIKTETRTNTLYCQYQYRIVALNRIPGLAKMAVTLQRPGTTYLIQGWLVHQPSDFRLVSNDAKTPLKPVKSKEIFGI